jgi:putative inorganic carbon (HCO3(-)) transporter
MIVYYVFVLSMPLISHSVFGSDAGGMTVTKYLGLACLAYALVHWPARRRPAAFLATAQARWFLVFYGLVLASYGVSLLGPRPGQASALTIYTAQVVFFITTVIVVDSLERLRNVMLVAIGSVALASLYVLREWWGGSSVYGSGYRPGYVTGDPNFFSASALLCLPLAFAWTIGSRPRWERLYCGACLFIGLAGIMVAASRGGFLGLLAGLAVLIWHSRVRGRALGFVAAALTAFLLFSPSSPLDRLLNPTEGDVQARDARFQLWSAGFRMIASNPVFGVGPGNFKSQVSAYAPVDESPDFISHNGYLDVAAELGLPALVPLITMMWFTCRTAARIRQRTRQNGPGLLHLAALGIEAGVVGFAVALFFVSGLFLKLFWLMVFLSMCLPALVPREGEVGQQRPAA